jgi:hypothetical protein
MVAVSRQCALKAEDARHEQPWGSETSTGDKEAYLIHPLDTNNSRPASRHHLQLCFPLVLTLLLLNVHDPPCRIQDGSIMNPQAHKRPTATRITAVA